jgi:hypothetical protein
LRGAGFAPKMAIGLSASANPNPETASALARATGWLRARARGLTILAALVLCLLASGWPRDIPFVNDEAWLLSNALEANQHGQLAEHGLMGSRGVRYGPVATWMYQGLLLGTHDIVRIAQAHAFVLMAATAFALLWLARVLGLPRGLVLIALLSPHLWLANRALWDNNLCIPLCALALAAYASFVARPRAWPLTLALTSLMLALLVHLSAVAVAVPVGVHLLLTRRHFLWRARLLPLGPPLLLLVPALPFLRDLLAQTPDTTTHALRGTWWFASLGGRVLGASGLDYYVGGAWSESFLGGAMGIVVDLTAYLGHGLVWAGMALATYGCARAVRNPIEWTPRTEVGVLVLGAWLAQTLLNVVTRTALHPHYYNATFPIYVVFAGLALDTLARRRLAGNLTLLQGAALATVLALLFPALHATRGTRSLHYGIALGEQIDVTRALAGAHPASTIQTAIPQLRHFPHAQIILLRLSGQRPDTSLPLRIINVAFASADPSVAALAIKSQPPTPAAVPVSLPP